MFLYEWSNYLDRLTTIPQEVIITGDLNFHFNDPTDINVHRFTGKVDAYGLAQHVTGVNHIRGHTLEVILQEKAAPSSREVRLLSTHVCMIFEVKTQVTILPFMLH